jgi:signal recognition particle receptor subunit beta
MAKWILVFSVVVGVLSIAFVMFLAFGRAKRRKEVLLIGLTSSGKTRLFYHLVTKQSLSTVTSQQFNEWVILFKNRQLLIRDVPGHPRVRTEAMNALRLSDGVVFVIDSETFLKEISDIANLLYDLLSLPEIVRRRVPVLIVGAKSDLLGARPPSVIRSELEGELGTIRANRQQSNYVESGDAAPLFLGDENAAFKFDQLSNPVTFGQISVTANETGDVLNFLERIAS